ncbi:hypothetical protein [Nostoc flagelliforme]|nr:hypothetical protein [Nostoc flagelliforme]
MKRLGILLFGSPYIVQGYFILKEGAMWYAAKIILEASTTVSEMEIIRAFADIKDPRRRAGQRHNLPLCLALFTLA